MPPAVGSDRGPRPPEPSRALPARYISSVMFGKNLGVILGLVFMAVGLPIDIVAVCLMNVPGPARFILLPFGDLFFLIGLFVFLAGRRSGRRRIEALEHGVAAEGEILDVTKDMTQEMNGRRPWRVEYFFVVGGQRVGGEVVSWSLVDGARNKGEPVWVVYIPSDPGINSVWPPIV